ncbi:MAG: GatB/YqeY domain-containing protein [Candidatus Xenobia bacterium]
MSLVERINEDLKQAMKAQEATRLSTLRMMKSALHLKHVEARVEVTDEMAQEVLQRLTKQRKDSIEQFEQGNRPDLAEKERQELAIISEYLPQQADEATVRRIVDEVVAELGATSPKQMGAVMSQVMARLKGYSVDGKQISTLVKGRLTG